MSLPMIDGAGIPRSTLSDVTTKGGNRLGPAPKKCIAKDTLLSGVIHRVQFRCYAAGMETS